MRLSRKYMGDVGAEHFVAGERGIVLFSTGFIRRGWCVPARPPELGRSVASVNQKAEESICKMNPPFPLRPLATLHSPTARKNPMRFRQSSIAPNYTTLQSPTTKFRSFVLLTLENNSHRTLLTPRKLKRRKRTNHWPKSISTVGFAPGIS